MNAKMRKSIFIVSELDIVSGKIAAASRMHKYAKSLADKNTVYMISLSRLSDDANFEEIRENVFTTTTTVKYKYIRFNNVIPAIRRFNKLYKQIKGDKCIVYYPTTSSLIFDIILLLLYRKNMYAEVNEIRKFASESQSRFLLKINDTVYSMFYEMTFSFYKGIIFISKNIQSYYANKNKNNIVIPILSDMDDFSTVKRARFQTDSHIVFVFAGSVSFEKENLYELLQGFRLFSDTIDNVRLLFYGSINKSNSSRLKQVLSDLSLGTKVEYKGEFTQKEIASILKNADCLLLPRSNNKQNYYGFSTKLSEYALSGTPIIMTNTGVVADYFKDRENCLLCEGYDRDSFMRKFLEFALLDTKKRGNIAVNALNTALRYFNYKNFSNKLDNFLK